MLLLIINLFLCIHLKKFVILISLSLNLLTTTTQRYYGCFWGIVDINFVREGRVYRMVGNKTKSLSLYVSVTVMRSNKPNYTKDNDQNDY